MRFLFLVDRFPGLFTLEVPRFLSWLIRGFRGWSECLVPWVLDIRGLPKPWVRGFLGLGYPSFAKIKVPGFLSSGQSVVSLGLPVGEAPQDGFPTLGLASLVSWWSVASPGNNPVSPAGE